MKQSALARLVGAGDHHQVSQGLGARIQLRDAAEPAYVDSVEPHRPLPSSRPCSCRQSRVRSSASAPGSKLIK